MGIGFSFHRRFFNDFNTIFPYLCAINKRILDIGCGLGGIDILLHFVYGSRLYMMDKNMIDDKIIYGYNATTSAYNKLDLTADLLTMNGVPRSDIVMIEADDNISVANCSLIISLISLGFHYPVSTYLKMISKSLAPCGVLILDIRKNTDQMQTIRDNFKNIRQIREYEKHWRIACDEIVIR